MEDSDWWIVGVIGIIVVIVLFFGFFSALKNTIKLPSPQGTSESAQMIKKQKRLTDELEEQQKRLKEERAMRIRDTQRN